MKRIIIGALLLAACGGTDSNPTLLPPPSAEVPDLTSTTTSTTTPVPTVEACGPSPFVPTVLPDRVSDRPPTRDLPYDQYTIISGTSTSVWSQEDGAPVLAIVRGSFPPPPARWLETPEVITVRGVEAALAPLPDGIYGVAWFEGPDRCDEYTIVLYPPATREELIAVVESLLEGERSP